MAVGCGWQAFVAYVNVGCYYIIGVPLGAVLGFKFNLGAKVYLYIYIYVCICTYIFKKLNLCPYLQYYTSMSCNNYVFFSFVFFTSEGNMVGNDWRYSYTDTYLVVGHLSDWLERRGKIQLARSFDFLLPLFFFIFLVFFFLLTSMLKWLY